MYFLAISFLILVAFISPISGDPIKVYCDNSFCGKGPSGSLTEFSIDVSPIDDCLTCKLKDNVDYNNFTDFYPTKYCTGVSNKCNNGTEIFIEGLLEQLKAISEFLYSYPTGCLEILQRNNLATSGYYTIRAPNDSFISVYCDMEGSNCNGQGGWMRIGYLNMSEPGATCPLGLALRQYNNIDHGVCGIFNSGTFVSTSFSSGGNNYSEVCGQIRGYQYKSPDGFPPVLDSKANLTIENCNTYVDGITITYGSNPRKHIWTYACGLNEGFINFNGILTLLCPCNNISTGTIVPSFVGSDHYCESGLPAGQFWQSVLYSNDPLWDGQQCNGNEGPCCTNPMMPWFIKTLNETTTEDIELRVCASQGYNDEDIPLDIIELYVR